VSRRHAASIVYGAGLAQGLVGAAFPASAAVLRASGLGDVSYGSLFVPQTALAALGAASAGPLLRGLGARRCHATGTLLMALSQGALALCPVLPHGLAYPAALLGTSLLGAGAGFTAAPLNAYPQVLFPSRSESALVALHAVTGLGLALAPLLAGAALERGVWVTFPVLLLVAQLVVTRAIGRAALPELEPARTAESAGRPLDSRALWVFVAVTYLYGLTECVFGNWTVVFLGEDRHLGPAMAGAGAAAFWAALGAGRVGIAAVLLRVPPAPVLPALAALMAVGALLVPLAQSPGSGIALFSLAGLGGSAILPLALGLGGRRFADHRAWVAGVLYAALMAGQGTGSFAAGALRPAIGLASVFRLAAVPPAAACALALALALRARRT
jgi:fucose permease